MWKFNYVLKSQQAANVNNLKWVFIKNLWFLWNKNLWAGDFSFHKYSQKFQMTGKEPGLPLVISIQWYPQIYLEAKLNDCTFFLRAGKMYTWKNESILLYGETICMELTKVPTSEPLLICKLQFKKAGILCLLNCRTSVIICSYSKVLL